MSRSDEGQMHSARDEPEKDFELNAIVVESFAQSQQQYRESRQNRTIVEVENES